VWVLDQRRMDRDEIADYQSKYSAQADDFVRQYNEWLQTPPQDRTEMPLLLDEDGNTKSRELLRREQQGRLMANLDKLVAGAATNPSLADILYGENWQQELNNYKKRQECNRIVLTCSIITASAGGIVHVVWLSLLFARLVVRAANGMKKLISRAGNVVKRKDQSEEDVKTSEAVDDAPEAGAEEQQEDEPENRPRITVQPTASLATDRPRRSMGTLTQRPERPRERRKAGVLLANDESVAVEMPSAREPVRLDLNEAPKPIDNTLNDLTQQVSAIREYAANQQNRLEKLQDGYDWNIIRTFCLRIIRCIDNIDSKIEQLAKKKAERTHLEEVKDELIFALESSGIEQFEPEINTEYRGQEKCAEAVKDKASCDDPEQAGKIASVVRPGYQYFIDDENIKVVRPAQVKLYA